MQTLISQTLWHLEVFLPSWQVRDVEVYLYFCIFLTEILNHNRDIFPLSYMHRRNISEWRKKFSSCYSTCTVNLLITFLSYPILSCHACILFYRVFILSGFPNRKLFIRFCDYRVSWRLFIRFFVYPLSGFELIMYFGIHRALTLNKFISLETSHFLFVFS